MNYRAIMFVRHQQSTTIVFTANVLSSAILTQDSRRYCQGYCFIAFIVSWILRFTYRDLIQGKNTVTWLQLNQRSWVFLPSMNEFKLIDGPFCFLVFFLFLYDITAIFIYLQYFVPVHLDCIYFNWVLCSVSPSWSMRRM